MQLKKKIINFLFVHISVYVCIFSHVCGFPQRPERRVRSPEAGVMGLGG